MAITSTEDAKVNGTIGTGNAVDGISINGNASTISLNPGGGAGGDAGVGGGAGADADGINFGDNPQNNIDRLVITNGATVTINGNLGLAEGSEIVIEPHLTLNIGGLSFTAGNEPITYIYPNVNTYQVYGSCRIDDLFGNHNDDDHDPSGVGMMVMGDEALPLVDAISC